MKLYKSKAWLRKKYVEDGLSETEIAELCNTTQVTINTWLRKHGLKREK